MPVAPRAAALTRRGMAPTLSCHLARPRVSRRARRPDLTPARAATRACRRSTWEKVAAMRRRSASIRSESTRAARQGEAAAMDEGGDDGEPVGNCEGGGVDSGVDAEARRNEGLPCPDPSLF